MSLLSREELYGLAETAVEVLNWSMRAGMKKPQQLDEIVKAFRSVLEMPPEVEVSRPVAEERETKGPDSFTPLLEAREEHGGYLPLRKALKGGSE